MSVEVRIVEFLMALEASVEPHPRGAHHLLYAKRCESKSGAVTSELLLQLAMGEQPDPIYIDPGDFKRPIDELVGEVLEIMKLSALLKQAEREEQGATQ